MIDRVTIKQRGKAAFMANFWICVLVALVLTVLVSGGGIGGGISSGFNTTLNLNHRDVPGIEGFSGFSQGMQDFDPDMFFEQFNAAGGGIVFGVLAGVVAIAGVIGVLLGVFLIAPLQVGGCRFFFENGERSAAFETLAFPFKTNYMNVVKTMFLQNLFIFLWSLLFLIPGIIKSYAYRLVPYILAEAPDIDAREARVRSEEMMKGHKWEAFVYDLSFLGWDLLAVCTCGILAIFYVNPYKFASDAELYRAIKFINYGGYVPPMRSAEPQAPAGGNTQYYAPYGNAPQQPQDPYAQQYAAPQNPQYPYPPQNPAQQPQDPYAGQYGVPQNTQQYPYAPQDPPKPPQDTEE